MIIFTNTKTIEIFTKLFKKKLFTKVLKKCQASWLGQRNIRVYIQRNGAQELEVKVPSCQIKKESVVCKENNSNCSNLLSGTKTGSNPC